MHSGPTDAGGQIRRRRRRPRGPLGRLRWHWRRARLSTQLTVFVLGFLGLILAALVSVPRPHGPPIRSEAVRALLTDSGGGPIVASGPATPAVPDLTADARMVLALPEPPLPKFAFPPEAHENLTVAVLPAPLLRPEPPTVRRPPPPVPRPPVAERPVPVPPPVAAPPPAPTAPGRVRVAIVIDDMGNNAAAARRAAALPAPLTLSFLPDGDGVGPLVDLAAGRGHEIFLHLPMEPLGTEDPGPHAILVGQEPSELGRRLAWALGRVPRAAGLNNHMGSRATGDYWTMLPLLQEVRRRDLVFIDSRTSPLSIAADVAANLGVPRATRDVFLDNDPSPSAIRAQLDALERVARRRGEAIAIGHPYATTLEALASWLPGAGGRGVTLVKASSLARRCEPQTISVAACGPDDGVCAPAPGC